MHCSSSCVQAQANSAFLFVLQQQSVPLTKQQATKCPHNETASDEVHLQQNGWRQIVAVPTLGTPLPPCCFPPTSSTFQCLQVFFHINVGLAIVTIYHRVSDKLLGFRLLRLLSCAHVLWLSIFTMGRKRHLICKGRLLCAP